MNDLTDSKVLVIGGAGFVGSHIVDQLLDEPVQEVVVLDSFVRGTRENLAEDRELLGKAMEGVDYVFDLAGL